MSNHTISKLPAYIIGIFLFLVFFLLSCKQDKVFDMQPTEGYPMLESLEEIKTLLADKCIDTISFQKGEVVADIGAGNGYLEAMLAIFHDSVTFYVQDIDTLVCNQSAVDRVVHFYESVNGKPFSCRFFVVNGTDTETNLPDIGFDRIFMLWTYQYLKEPRVFIKDIRKNLMSDGLLYVINPEQEYEYGKMLYNQYGWNGSTIERQIDDIIACGYTLIRIGRNYGDNQQPYIMVFKKK